MLVLYLVGKNGTMSNYNNFYKLKFSDFFKKIGHFWRLFFHSRSSETKPGEVREKNLGCFERQFICVFENDKKKILSRKVLCLGSSLPVATDRVHSAAL